MKQASKEEFYKFLETKNAQCSVEGNYPYTTVWKDKYGNIIAKHVERYPDDGIYPTISDYYIKSI